MARLTEVINGVRTLLGPERARDFNRRAQAHKAKLMSKEYRAAVAKTRRRKAMPPLEDRVDAIFDQFALMKLDGQPMCEAVIQILERYKR